MRLYLAIKDGDTQETKKYDDIFHMLDDPDTLTFEYRKSIDQADKTTRAALSRLNEIELKYYRYLFSGLDDSVITLLKLS